MKVSICIPTRNRVTSLKRTVVSITLSDYDDYEILLIDNSDNEQFTENANLYSIDKRIKHVEANHHIGIAALRQMGIEISRGEIIAFVDDDVEVPSQWLTAIVSAFSENQELGIYGCAVENIGFDNIPMGNVKGWGKKMGTNGAFKPVIEANEIVTFGEFNLVMRKIFVEIVGGFDTRFKWGYEGADLTHRMLLAGCDIEYNEDVVIQHSANKYYSRPRIVLTEFYRLIYFFKYHKLTELSLIYEIKRIYYALIKKDFHLVVRNMILLISIPILYVYVKFTTTNSNIKPF